MDGREAAIRAARSGAIAAAFGFCVTTGFLVLDMANSRCDAGGECVSGYDVFGHAENLGWYAGALAAPALFLTPLPAERRPVALAARSLAVGALVGYFVFVLSVPVERSHGEAMIAFLAGALAAVGAYLYGLTPKPG